MPRTSISQAPFDLIVAEEITSPAYYEKMYRHPDWPGGRSGVTIGIGYDLGYATVAEVDHDWADLVSPDMLRAMKSVVGITGSPAQSHAHSLRGVVDIPVAAAMAVFKNRDIPKWIKLVEHELPNTDDLPDDAFGAILSLSFNRGASGFHMHDARNVEMHAIHDMMVDKDFDSIPDEFRKMKRLWPSTLSLQRRREHEAVLFENSL